MTSPEQRLKDLGIELAVPRGPAGAYRPVVIDQGLAWLSGQGPIDGAGNGIFGRVPDEVSMERAVEAARWTGVNALSMLRVEIGSLDRVEKIVKITGYVCAAPGFTEHPKVIDGFSTLMVDIFGDAGRAARAAVGVATLPFGLVVEVDMVARLKD